MTVSRALLFSMLLWQMSASHAFAATAPPRCTLEQTIMRAAKGNRCFEELLVKTKNSEDRAWLLSIQQTWKPDPSLKIQLVPGGIILIKDNAPVLDARIVFLDPLILSWNDKLIEPPNKKIRSVIKLMVDVLSPKVASWFSFLPTAVAQLLMGRAEEDLFTLYLLNSGTVVDAEGMIKVGAETDLNRAHVFPQMNFYEKHFSGRSLTCTNDGGLESITYDYNRDNWTTNYRKGRAQKWPVTIKALSPTKFEITGLMGTAGDKKLIADYRGGSFVGMNSATTKNAQTVLGDSAMKVVHYSICEDDACTKTAEVKNKEELMTHQRPDFNLNIFDLNPSVFGASALANCCKNTNCRSVAKKLLNIDLQNQPSGGESTTTR